MRRLLVLAAAPLAISVAFAGSAIADEDARLQSDIILAQVDDNDDDDVDDFQDDPAGPDDERTGAIDADAFTIVSAIQASGMTIPQVQAATDATFIEIVRVGDVLSPDEQIHDLDNAVAENQPQIDELRAAIQANPAVANRFTQEAAQVEDVMAATTTADGSLVFYVR